MADLLAKRIGKIKPSPTVAISTLANQLKAEGKDVINLGTGEPDFDTPGHIKEAAIEAIRGGQTNYTPVPGTAELRKAIAAKLKDENGLEYGPDQIIASTGAKECLINLMNAVVDDGDEVLIPAPYWVSYPDMALLCGGVPKVVTCGMGQGFKLRPEQLEETVTPKSKLLVVNSPSNPSGCVYTREELGALAEVVRPHDRLVVCSDDIYEHITYGAKFAGILDVAPDLGERTVVVNGVSKFYAMTGWRLGYAAGNAAIIKAMAKVQSQGTTCASAISQAAAAAALRGGTKGTAEMLEAFRRRRDLVIGRFAEIPGLECPPIDGAFYAFPHAGEAIAGLRKAGKIAEETDVALCEHMLQEAGVAAVPGSAFGMEDHFRISFATSDELLEDALGRIAKALAA